jgi:hypothetical protein
MSARSGRVGLAALPLHSGRAPAWLFGRMVRRAREILGHVVADYGPGEVLERLSDPFWFQALGCVLGFDWHSSGVTTTTCGAIKEAVRGVEDGFGFVVAGGKGAASRKTPVEIERACERLGQDPAFLVKASRQGRHALPGRPRDLRSDHRAFARRPRPGQGRPLRPRPGAEAPRHIRQ